MVKKHFCAVPLLRGPSCFVTICGPMKSLLQSRTNLAFAGPGVAPILGRRNARTSKSLGKAHAPYTNRELLRPGDGLTLGLLQQPLAELRLFRFNVSTF
jgi:hypothetical protein